MADQPTEVTGSGDGLPGRPSGWVNPMSDPDDQAEVDQREQEADWGRRMTYHLLQGQPEGVHQVHAEIRAAARMEVDQDAADRTAHEANRRAHQLLLHVLQDQHDEAVRLLDGIPEGLQLDALTYGVLGTAPGIELGGAASDARQRALQAAHTAVAAHRAKGVPDDALARMYRTAAERSYRLSEGELLRPY